MVGRRVSPKSDRREGWSLRSGSARSNARRRRSAAPPDRVRPCACAAAAKARPAIRRLFLPPRREAVPVGGRRNGRRGLRCAARSTGDAQPREGSAPALAPARCAAKGDSQGSSSDDSTTSSSGHTNRAADHGSASRSTPMAAATAPLTSRPGKGNSTFAHTPSARPGDAPSTAERRCVSQRSTPRVGTAMSSACMGSSRGEPTTAASRVD